MESLAGSKIFSSLDAAQAFHNVPIEEDSQDCTAFVCMYGLFKPVRAPVRKIKPGHQESLRKQIDSWLRDGVIAPAVSPWGSPLVPVAKKDGTTRWAVDYRELNKSTLPDAYPTPCLSHIVESLAGSKVFSSLDAAQAFHNVPIEEDSQDCTAFVCMYGLFKFKRMPFGLKNAGVVYCRLVAQIMDNLGLQLVAHYFDDMNGIDRWRHKEWSSRLRCQQAAAEQLHPSGPSNWWSSLVS